MYLQKIIAHSIGPNGIEIFTLLCEYPWFIHCNILEDKNISHSVFDVTDEHVLKQVKERPAMPVLWPKEHHGMQGTEVMPSEKDKNVTGYRSEYCSATWLGSRDKMLDTAGHLAYQGLSKQLTNRLIEPWVMCRDVMTFTKPQIEGFFALRHPTFLKDKDFEVPEGALVDQVNDEIDLDFPAEYNIQQLAICMKKAMDESTPTKLEEGQWHLPFVTEEDMIDIANSIPQTKEVWESDPAGQKLFEEKLIRLSASRAAITSYNTNKGHSIEMELDLAKRLVDENHWGPFEHQAMAIDEDVEREFFERTMKVSLGTKMVGTPKHTEGIELRVNAYKDWDEIWSRNFQGWVQARATLDS